MNMPNSSALQSNVVAQFNNVKTAESLEELKSAARLGWKVLVLATYAVGFVLTFTYEQGRPQFNKAIAAIQTQYKALRRGVNNGPAPAEDLTNAPTIVEQFAMQDDTWPTPTEVTSAIADSVLQTAPTATEILAKMEEEDAEPTLVELEQPTKSAAKKMSSTTRKTRVKTS